MLPALLGEVLKECEIKFEDVSPLKCDYIFSSVSVYSPLFDGKYCTFQSDINLKRESPSQFNKLDGQFRHEGITLSHTKLPRK